MKITKSALLVSLVLSSGANAGLWDDWGDADKAEDRHEVQHLRPIPEERDDEKYQEHILTRPSNYDAIATNKTFSRKESYQNAFQSAKKIKADSSYIKKQDSEEFGYYHDDWYDYDDEQRIKSHDVSSKAMIVADLHNRIYKTKPKLSKDDQEFAVQLLKDDALLHIEKDPEGVNAVKVKMHHFAEEVRHFGHSCKKAYTSVIDRFTLVVDGQRFHSTTHGHHEFSHFVDLLATLATGKLLEIHYEHQGRLHKAYVPIGHIRHIITGLFTAGAIASA